MECPTCYAQGKTLRLDFTHRVWAAPGVRVQRAECPGCLKVQVVVQFVFGEVEGKGTGAHGIAKKIEDGDLIPTLLGLPSAPTSRPDDSVTGQRPVTGEFSSL